MKSANYYNVASGAVKSTAARVMYAIALTGMVVTVFSRAPQPIVSASSFSCGTYSSAKASPSGSGTLRSVTDDGSLTTAIAAAQPGDVIELADGTYTRFELLSMNGTSSNPITFQAANKWAVDISVAGTAQSGVLVRKSSYVNIYGIDVNGGGTSTGSAFRTGMRYSNSSGTGGDGHGSVDPLDGGSSYINFEHNRAQSMGQEAFSFKSQYGGGEPSSFIVAECNEVDGTGQRSTSCSTESGSVNFCGEGFYIGNGLSGADTTHDIIIRGNDIHGIHGAEAIEAKATTYNVSILDNHIYDVEVSNGGAIVLGLGGPSGYQDGNFLVEGNVMHGITRISTYNDGNAIAVAHGTSTIRNNIIYDLQHNAIVIYDRNDLGFSTSNTDVFIYNNTFNDCGSGVCVGVSGSTGSNSPNVVATNNLSEDLNQFLSSGNRLLSEGSDFAGPLTGAADAGSGAGSGYALVSASGAVDSAATIGSFSSDIDGTSRPSGSAWDFGAYEYVSSGGSSSPPIIIFDTDLGPDIDDALALAMLHAYESNGDATLAAVTISRNSDYGARYADLVNTFYGRPSIPIGKYFGTTGQDGNDRYAQALAVSGTYPHDVHSSSIEEGYKVMRQVLADSPDDSVVLLQTGFSVNTAALISSPADSISSLTGLQLINQKVRFMSIMAGENSGAFAEFNIDEHLTSAQTVFSQWPIDVIQSEHCMGNNIMYPYASIQSDYSYTANHPIKDSYENEDLAWHEDSPPYYNMRSWDLLSTIAAVEDLNTYFNISAAGDVTVNGSGITSFSANPSGKFKSMGCANSYTSGELQTIVDRMIELSSQQPDSNAAPVITSNGGAATAAVSVAENQTAVTTVTETDADGSDTHTYTLTGGADQTDFSIGSTSGVLTFSSAPNFEVPTDTGTNNTYEVEVTVTDNGSPAASDMQTITVTVTDAAEGGANNAPTAVALSNSTVAENTVSGSSVGILTTTDADVSDTHSYSLVSGTGDEDNAKFTLGGSSSTLNLAFTPDFESPTDLGAAAGNNTYSILVRTDDSNGGTYDQVLIVTVTNINAPPSSLALDSSTIPAALTGAGSGIGDLSASDDGEDTATLTYSLVAGTGDTGNASFQIGGSSNDELQTAATLSAATYSIRVNVSDGVNDVASVFSITVQAGSDVVAPTISYSGANPISLTVGDAYSAPSVTASDVIDGNLTSSIVVAGDTVAVDGSGNVTTAGSYTLTYNVSDTASNVATQLSIVVNVAAASGSGGGGSGDGGGSGSGGGTNTDDDNISDEVEDAAPNSGDNNGDGTADSQQSNVSTAPNAAVNTNVDDDNNDFDASSSNPSRYVSLQLPSAATVTNFTIVSEETGDKQDSDYDYPLGLFDFTATVPTGSTQEIVIYLDQQYDTSDWIWRKYDTSNDTYTTVEDAVFGEVTVDEVVLTTVTYDITDGGTLDQDNAANGTIVDPAGPAVLAATGGSGDTESLEDTGVGVSLIVIAGSALALVAMTMATTTRRVVYVRK